MEGDSLEALRARLAVQRERVREEEAKACSLEEEIRRREGLASRAKAGAAAMVRPIRPPSPPAARGSLPLASANSLALTFRVDRASPRAQAPTPTQMHANSLASRLGSTSVSIAAPRASSQSPRVVPSSVPITCTKAKSAGDALDDTMPVFLRTKPKTAHVESNRLGPLLLSPPQVPFVKVCNRSASSEKSNSLGFASVPAKESSQAPVITSSPASAAAPVLVNITHPIAPLLTFASSSLSQSSSFSLSFASTKTSSTPTLASEEAAASSGPSPATMPLLRDRVLAALTEAQDLYPTCKERLNHLKIKRLIKVTSFDRVLDDDDGSRNRRCVGLRVCPQFASESRTFSQEGAKDDSSLEEKVAEQVFAWMRAQITSENVKRTTSGSGLFSSCAADTTDERNSGSYLAKPPSSFHRPVSSTQSPLTSSCSAQHGASSTRSQGPLFPTTTAADGNGNSISSSKSQAKPLMTTVAQQPMSSPISHSSAGPPALPLTSSSSLVTTATDAQQKSGKRRGRPPKQNKMTKRVRGESTSKATESDEEKEQKEERYVVSHFLRVVKTKKKKCPFKLLVVWQGYDEDEATLEPALSILEDLGCDLFMSVLADSVGMKKFNKDSKRLVGPLSNFVFANEGKAASAVGSLFTSTTEEVASDAYLTDGGD